LSDSEELESEDDKSADSGNDEELKGNREGLITSDISYDNTEEHQGIRTNKIGKDFDAKDDVQANMAQTDFEEEEYMLKTINDSLRIQYVTKRERIVKLRKDLFENYAFLQLRVI
jgi:hypothetical protein